jgi:hypothetical protein
MAWIAKKDGFSVGKDIMRHIFISIIIYIIYSLEKVMLLHLLKWTRRGTLTPFVYVNP